MKIYSQLKTELNDFFQNKIHIAGSKQNPDARYLKNKNYNYEFSQNDMVNLVDLYYNSKFESGPMDSENQRKIFLNICKFRADVAAKQIDLDVKNFNFIPTDESSEWLALFMGKEFKQWARENYFGELINHCVEMFPRYGWIVLREVGGKLEFVPLQILRNQQDAKSLNEASYTILEHAEMSMSDIKKMKKWKSAGLSLKDGETTTVYERYGEVCLGDYYEYKGMNMEGVEYDKDEMVDCLSIVACDVNSKDDTGNVLFMEQISKRPFIEAHWAKQHGRLMGIGEIENQLENQVGANMSFNLFRRQLLWSSKKIFQSSNENASKNLVRDVKDGDVLEVGVNGDIRPVDMTNRAGADFNNFSAMLEKNSDQKSFTFEVATGAALPSGTPFRLGVILSDAVNSHFDMKREKLGLFFKRAIIGNLIPAFKREYSQERIISMFADEPGFETLSRISKVIQLNDEIKAAMIRGEMPDIEALKAKIELLNQGKRFHFVKLKEYIYDKAKYDVTLDITGEEIDLPRKMESLTNLYTSMAQKGDPRADKILARILAYAGENYDVLAGASAPSPQPTIDAEVVEKPAITANQKI